MKQPPVLFDKLLNWYCSNTDLEDIQGDLYEIYEERCEESQIKANALFIVDVLRLFVPFTGNKKRATWLSESYHFNLRNELVVCIRYLIKNPFIGTIKILGFAIALSAFMFINDYTEFHRQYDNFHVNRDRIYRLVTKVTSSEIQDETAWSHSYIKDIEDDFPEIEHVVRLQKFESSAQVVVGTKSFEEHEAYFTDPEFGIVFTYDWLEGDAGSALDDPRAIVITSKAAHKYFGTNKGIIGKTIQLNNETRNITGVIGDIPSNSDLQFELLLPFTEHVLEEWTFVYLQTNKHSRIENLSQGYAGKLKDYNEHYLAQGITLEYEFENITDVHFSAPKLYDTAKIDSRRIALFQALGLIIMLIAFVNYINLYTSQVLHRINSLTVQMIVGASRKQLFFQFVTDAVFYLGVACMAGMLITYLIHPTVSYHAGFEFFDLEISLWMLTFYSVGFIILILFLSSYALWLVNRYSALGLKQVKGIKANFRKTLIGIQFAMSFALIFCSAIVYQQTEHLQNQNIGFNAHKVLTLGIPNHYTKESQFRTLKNDLKQLSSVRNASIVETNSIPGMDPWIEEYFIDHNDEMKLFEELTVDESFIETLQVEMTTGEFFSNEKNHRPYHVFVVNEAFADHMGWSEDEALGKTIESYGNGPIIGVTKNFFFNSPHDLIQPLIINYNQKGRRIMVRLDESTDVLMAFNQISGIWEEHFPNNPFDFSFLMTDYASQFKQEQATLYVFGIVSGLVIVLSLLGMYSILLMFSHIREKELGIRKVNGATLSDLFHLFSREFYRVYFISMAIAVPVLWYGMEYWLARYPIRISIEAVYFLGAAFIVLMAGSCVIFMNARRNYNSNIVDTLKYE